MAGAAEGVELDACSIHPSATDRTPALHKRWKTPENSDSETVWILPQARAFSGVKSREVLFSETGFPKNRTFR